MPSGVAQHRRWRGTQTRSEGAEGSISLALGPSPVKRYVALKGDRSRCKRWRGVQRAAGRRSTVRAGVGAARAYKEAGAELLQEISLAASREISQWCSTGTIN